MRTKPTKPESFHSKREKKISTRQGMKRNVKIINRKKRNEIDPNSFIKGGCMESNKYNHDFLHCNNCEAARNSAIRCNLNWCPCKGRGILFPTIDVEKAKSCAHQLDQDNKSVRICINRRKQAIPRIQKRVNMNIIPGYLNTDRLVPDYRDRAAGGLEFNDLLSVLNESGALTFPNLTSSLDQIPVTPLGDEEEEVTIFIINE